MRIHCAASLFLFHFWVLFCLRYWLGSTKTSINFSFLSKWIESFDFPRTPGQASPPLLNHFISKETQLCLFRLHPRERLPPDTLGQCFLFYTLVETMETVPGYQQSLQQDPTHRAVVDAAPFQHSYWGPPKWGGRRLSYHCPFSS